MRGYVSSGRLRLQVQKYFGLPLAASCLFLNTVVAAAPSLQSLTPALPGSATSEVARSAQTETSTRSVEDRLAEARQNLAIALIPGDNSLTNTPSGISAPEISIRRALLRRLVRLYEQQLSTSAELEDRKSVV